MRILTDVNINAEVARRLKKEGMTVKRADTPRLRNKTDEELIEYAKKRKLIILTQDKDFLKTEKEHEGIIYLPKRTTPSETARRITNMMKHLNQEDLKNQVIFLSRW